MANLSLVDWDTSSRQEGASDSDSPSTARRCFAIDNGTELRSACLDGPKPLLATGFMGDSPWVGMAAGRDYCAALTQNGTLYVL